MIKLQIKPKQRVGLTTHFATHHKKSVDFEEKNSTFCSFNPFVVGLTPARPTKTLVNMTFPKGASPVAS